MLKEEDIIQRHCSDKFHAAPLFKKTENGGPFETQTSRVLPHTWDVENLENKYPSWSPIKRVVSRIRNSCGLRQREPSEGIHLGALPSDFRRQISGYVCPSHMFYQLMQTPVLNSKYSVLLAFIQEMGQGNPSLFLQRASSVLTLSLSILFMCKLSTSQKEGNAVIQDNEASWLPFPFHTTAGQSPVFQGIKAIFLLVLQSLSTLTEHRSRVGVSCLSG